MPSKKELKQEIRALQRELSVTETNYRSACRNYATQAGEVSKLRRRINDERTAHRAQVHELKAQLAAKDAPVFPPVLRGHTEDKVIGKVDFPLAPRHRKPEPAVKAVGIDKEWAANLSESALRTLLAAAEEIFGVKPSPVEKADPNPHFIEDVSGLDPLPEEPLHTAKPGDKFVIVRDPTGTAPSGREASGRILKDAGAKVGDVLVLSKQDGSDNPWFAFADGRALKYFKETISRGVISWAVLAPLPTDPAPNACNGDCLHCPGKCT